MIITSFDPVKYSVEENEFFLEALGKPPIVAMKSCPAGVNPRAVRPMLDRVYELVELERHNGADWTGLEPIKAKIRVYLEQSERWSADRRKGAPRFPTMSSFDGKNRPHLQGVGSDAQKVSTYFEKDGSRTPFEIQLVPDGIANWVPEWGETDKPSDGLVVNTPMRRIECSICGHTESFNPDSRGSFNAARARTSKHLRTSTIEVDRHRELHTNEFGG